MATLVPLSKSRRSTSNGGASGFKVYGSVFKVSPRYQFLNPLGKGSYGIVCAAKDRETGQNVAIKKVAPMAKRTVDAKHTLRELLLLQHLGKHPNVISVHHLSANLKDDELYIVMDLMDTDMHRVIQSSQPLSDAHAKYFLHQLLRGVKYLHDNRVLHRDLKPGNLLLSKNCQLKIADFGLARKIPRGYGANSTALERPRSAPAANASVELIDRPPMTEHVVTRWYRAPELMLQPDGLYDQSVDMWSVGCIFAEILGRKALFPGKNFLHQLTLIFDVIGAPSPEATSRIQSSQAQRFLRSLDKKPKVPFHEIFPCASAAAVDLLDRLLEFDSTKRISAQEALCHPYMQEIEGKYRSRSGDADPPPPTCVDFSFDLKNLTKMDLRALIVQEVDNHRKSVMQTTSVSAALVSSKKGGSVRENLSEVDKSRVMLTPSETIASITPTTASDGVRTRKVHVSLRQGQAHSRQDEGNTNTQRVAIGSNRQRIRTNSKPPVPKAQASNGGSSNQHEHVRVIAAQASLLSDSLVSRVSQPEDGEAKFEPKSQDVQCAAYTTVSKSEEKALLEEPKSYNRTSLSAQTNRGQSHFDAVPESTDDYSKSSIATAIASNKRSKAMIASLMVSETTPEGIIDSEKLQRTATSFYHSQAWQAKQDRNPVSLRSLSSSSYSSTSSRNDLPRPKLIPEKSRTHRAGSGMLLTKSKRGNFNVVAALAIEKPRRVSSADPTRSKRHPLSEKGPHTAKNAHVDNPYVGSTNSLIRAQRLKNGQSLADSANHMLANMDQNRQQESFDSREERIPLSGSLQLQRSTPKLPCADVRRRHSLKKPTVPKSPKFSVMSWQKKTRVQQRPD